MYDHVDIKIKCPKCGTILNDFQTKDGPCCYDNIGPLSVFKRGPYGKRDTLIAYDICENCNCWVDVEMPLVPVTNGIVMVSPMNHKIECRSITGD